MYTLSKITTGLALLSGAFASFGFERSEIDSFVTSERAISLQGALNNIGPDGSEVAGAGAGFVVASPSKVNPNYFYTWTRDSALTLKMIIDEYILGNTSLKTIIDQYIHAQAVLQTTSNPSGSFLPDGLGLGEPKFLVDGNRFNGPWGRPQNDGPALRAIALITYSKWLIENSGSMEAKDIIWPIIANDLSFVGQYWNSTGFDLWEEVDGSSFFTVQNQHRSLVEGAQLAKTLGVPCTGCDQAPQVLCFLQDFWNGEYVVSNINTDVGRTGLDGNSILGPISIFDIDAQCDSPTFQPCHSKSLANFKAVVDSFRDLYSINSGIPQGEGIAVGRYAEDVYQGGNPWYLITTAAAEFLYDAVAQWNVQKNINIDSTSVSFFKDLYPNATVGNHNSTGDTSFSEIVDATTAYADSFLSVAEKYTPANGSLSEQFDKSTGAPLSAYDLTWSYAAFVTMAQRRSGQFFESWGSGNATLPATCSGTSTQGVYIPATAAGAPNTTACEVKVQFNVNATTYFGENIYLIGNTTDTGSWDLENALPLSADEYTDQRPLWTLSASLAAGETISFKYVREQNCGQSPIYETVNRTITVPACGTSNATREDSWIGKTGSSGDCPEN